MFRNRTFETRGYNKKRKFDITKTDRTKPAKANKTVSCGTNMRRAYDKYGPNLCKTETNRHYWGFFERTATPYYHLLAMKVHRLNYIELTLRGSKQIEQVVAGQPQQNRSFIRHLCW